MNILLGLTGYLCYHRAIMERDQKLELIQRSLGLKHKIKVHESMKAPETHEDMASMLLGKWELEDELKAIEEIITEERVKSVQTKKTKLAQNGPKQSK